METSELLQSPKPISWNVRVSSPVDLPFIIDSWRRSFAYSPEVDGCPADVYYPKMLNVLQRILSRPNAQVLVACPDSEEDSFFIGGWICYEDKATIQDHDRFIEGIKVHFVFSREKGLGMWNLLVRNQHLDKKPAVYTSWTKAMRRVTLPDCWRYDPFDKWEK